MKGPIGRSISRSSEARECRSKILKLYGTPKTKMDPENVSELVSLSKNRLSHHGSSISHRLTFLRFSGEIRQEEVKNSLCGKTVRHSHHDSHHD